MPIYLFDLNALINNTSYIYLRQQLGTECCIYNDTFTSHQLPASSKWPGWIPQMQVTALQPWKGHGYGSKGGHDLKNLVDLSPIYVPFYVHKTNIMQLILSET